MSAKKKAPTPKLALSKQLPQMKRTKINKLVTGMLDNAGIEQKKPEPITWDDVNELANNLHIAIMEYSTAVKDMLISVSRAYARLEEPLPDKVSLISKDMSMRINEVCEKFESIGAQHTGKTGEVLEEDYNLYLDIYGAYVDEYNRFQAIIFSTSSMLTEEQALANRKAQDIIKEEEAKEQHDSEQLNSGTTSVAESTQEATDDAADVSSATSTDSTESSTD